MNPATWCAVKLICLYQKTVSRLLPNLCRFQPTCSEYAKEAFQRHGFWHGLKLSVARIMRCHPFNPGGCDPVPLAAPKPSKAQKKEE